MTREGSSPTPRVVAQIAAGLGTLFLLGACAGKHADRPPTVKNDIVYATVQGKPLTLDACLPGGPGPHPAVILIHGGAWREGDKSECAVWGASYAGKGIAAFSINYRLSHEATYPAAVDDCLSAIRWVRAHAREYNVDPDRLGVEGGSAGGHLALMVALLAPDKSETDSRGKPLRQRVRCAVSYYGPTDLTDVASGKRSPEKMSVIRFLGGTHEQKAETYRAASPLTHVSPDDPPVLLVHGTMDSVVPHVQAQALQQCLQKAGVAVELISVQRAEHGLMGIGREEQMAVRARAEAFMVSRLRGK